MKKRIINLLKYNKKVYAIYHITFSFLINVLKIFVKPDDSLILFNSFAGRKYDDSPKAIYLAMKNDSRFENYKCVWALHNPNMFEIPGAETIKTDNLHYFITALKARVWITNSSVERGLSFKGKHTLYFNTWHGTPIKYMGSDIAADNESFGAKEDVICPYDVFCSQGSYETNIFSKSFNIPKDRFLESGLPRNDILANYTEDIRMKVREKLGIQSHQIAILYCPTFREYEKDENYGVVLAPPMDLKKWETELGTKYALLFRAHYEVSEVMCFEENSFVRNVTNYPDLNELMIASDVLLSDYSSIFFDYSIMGKPMLHFCYDYDKYSSKRGMYFDIRKWVDGADNEDVIIQMIKTINLDKKENTLAFRDSFVNYFGSASKQCIDCIAERVGS